MNKEFSDLNNLLTKIYPCFSSLLSPTSFPMSVIVSDFISYVSIEITKNLPTFSRLLSRVTLRCRTPTRDVYLADKSDTNIKSRNSDFRDQTWVRHESAKWLFSDCNTNVSWVIYDMGRFVWQLFYFLLFKGLVRFRQFLGRALWLGQAGGPRASLIGPTYSCKTTC